MMAGATLKVVSCTRTGFLNLAPSEERPTNECRSYSGIFYRCYCVNITSYNLCAKAKVKGQKELTRVQVEQTPSLVKLVEGF